MAIKKPLKEQVYKDEAISLLNRLIAKSDREAQTLEEAFVNTRDIESNLPTRLDIYTEADELEDMMDEEAGVDEEEIVGEDGLEYSPNDLDFLQGVWIGKVKQEFSNEEEKDAFKKSIDGELQSFGDVNYRWLEVTKEEETEEVTEEPEVEEVAEETEAEEGEEEIVESKESSKSIKKEAEGDEEVSEESNEEIEEISEEEGSIESPESEVYLLIYDYDIIEDENDDLTEFFDDNFEKIDIFDQEYEFLAEEIVALQDEEVEETEEAPAEEAPAEEVTEEAPVEEAKKEETEVIAEAGEGNIGDKTMSQINKAKGDVVPGVGDTVNDAPEGMKPAQTEPKATGNGKPGDGNTGDSKMSQLNTSNGKELQDAPVVNKESIDKETLKKIIRERVAKNKLKAKIQEKAEKQAIAKQFEAILSEKKKKDLKTVIEKKLEEKSAETKKEALKSKILEKIAEGKKKEPKKPEPKKVESIMEKRVAELKKLVKERKEQFSK